MGISQGAGIMDPGLNFNNSVLGAKPLFNDPNKPVGSWRAVSMLSEQPSATIFSESYPAEDEWKPYDTFPVKKCKGKLLKHCKPYNIVSKMWSGEVTTVENKFFG